MNHKILNKIKQIGHPTILVVGDVMLDRYIWGDVSIISPEAPVPIVSVFKEESRPGGAGCVIAALNALGAQTHLCGSIGDDPEGDELRHHLHGMVTGGAVPSRRITTVKTRILGMHNNHSLQHMVRIDRERKSEPEQYELNLVDGYLKQVQRTKHLDAIIVADYNKGFITPFIMKKITQTANTINIPLIIDPHRSTDYKKYWHATCIKLNRREAQTATGITITSDTIKSVGFNILKKFKTKMAIITLDKDGAYLISKYGKYFPTIQKDMCDISGAGDIVLAIIGIGMALKWHIYDIITIANAAAQAKISKLGAVPVSKNEIIKELKTLLPILAP